MSASLLMLLATVILNAVSVSGVEVAEYRDSVQKAHGIVIQVINENDGDKWVAGKNFDAASVVKIRQLLPIRQEVNLPQGPIEVSNQWLHSRLDHYVIEEDPEKQFTILVEIEERLSTVIWKIDELINASASDTSKDQAKQKISEILKREEYQKPSDKQKSSIEKWITDFLEWLFELFPKNQIEPSSSGLPNVAYWLQFVVLAIVILLLGFGIYKFAPIILPSLRRDRESDSEDRIILGETIEAGVSSDDLYAEADQMARNGDMRGAIRKGYIALLFELSRKKQIGLARNKTNRDYLGDMRKKPELYTDMKAITGVYESHWYGSAKSDESVWSGFKRLCKEASGRV